MTQRTRIMLIAGISLLVVLAACATPTSELQPSPSSTSPRGEIGGYGELIDALRDAGATVEPVQEVAQPFFAVPGQIIDLNGTQVQVFEYADAAARKADSDLISPDGYSIGTSIVTWVDQPNFWAQGRLIVLYVGSDQATIDLLVGLLGEPISSGDQGAT